MSCKSSAPCRNREIKRFIPCSWDKRFEKGNDAVYEVLNFARRFEDWEQVRRMLLSRRLYAGNQKHLEFARRRNVYVTNPGTGQPIDDSLRAIGKEKGNSAEVLKLAHSRGDSERTHRTLKEFGTETLPMIPFHPNNASFNVMVLSFNILMAFKDDVLPDEVVSTSCFPTTFRRTFLDVAGKVVVTGRYIYLNVTEAVYDRLSFEEIWANANSPTVSSLCRVSVAAENPHSQRRYTVTAGTPRIMAENSAGKPPDRR